MARVLLSVLQFRLNRRYVEAAPPFINIDLDHSDSGREGCAVSTLTITSEPRDWQGAIQVTPEGGGIKCSGCKPKPDHHVRVACLAGRHPRCSCRRCSPRAARVRV